MISGRIWKFGDNINTDAILPGHALMLPPQEQKKWVFHANRPGWIDEVQHGDIIVGGNSFGLGSSRPAARSLRSAGISCLLVESLSRLFFRNCVNWGLLALQCPGIHDAFDEGQMADISIEDLTVRNRDTGKIVKAIAVPDMLLSLMSGGGIYPVLESKGLIAPE